jgi:APA family basic amino acid/polyamine antiporter
MSPAVSSGASAPARLQKQLGSVQFFTIAFGAVVGVGWAVVLGDWLRQAGPVGAMLGLATGGLVIIVIGLCYAEVATMLPVSGGEVAFAYETFGERASFLTGWLLAFTYIAVAAFEAISIGWIVSALVPGIEGAVIYRSIGAEVRAGSLALGLMGMGLLTWLNFRGARAATRMQDVIIAALLVIALVFIVSGIARGDIAHLSPPFQRSASGSIWPGVLALFMTASFWFGGFNVVPQMMEERSPATRLGSVGVIIVVSIIVGIVFKTLVVLSASMAVPWSQLVTANLPVATAFETAFGSPVLARLVLLAALLGLLSTWNAVLMSAARVLFSLGRAGFISPRFGAVSSRFGSPAFAVIFAGALGAVGALLGRQALIPIVNAASACLAVAYLLTCLSLIRLRRTAPHVARPFRVPGGLVTAWVGVAGAALSVGLALYQPYADAGHRIPLEWILLASWLVIGLVFWSAARRLRSTVPAADRRRVIMGSEVLSPE